MNILLVGGNDGTHLIANMLLEDPTVTKVYHKGAFWKIQPSERYIPIPFEDESVIDQKTHLLDMFNIPDIDLVIPTALPYIIWPEFYNKIKSAGLPTLSPTPEIGMLEWQKSLGKQLLKELDIPTPDYYVYNYDTLIAEFFNIKRPFVFKFEKDDRIGLQTVIVTDDNCQEEYNVLKEKGRARMFSIQTQTLGPLKDPTFVIETFLEGSREYSYHVICNGVNWQYFGSARDYKKRYEGDVGYNTVGLGCYSINDINPIVHTYAEKIYNHLKANGKEWMGFMYLGIMEDKDGVPHVLEINTRLGNPELQVILPLLENNLKDLFYSTATNQHIEPIRFKDKAAVALRIINKDYHLMSDDSGMTDPDLPPEQGLYINFTLNRQQFNSSIVAVEGTVKEASDKIYTYLEGKEMHDFTYRKDIGYLK
jgi:phosphoribosylamine--glycine ligase